MGLALDDSLLLGSELLHASLVSIALKVDRESITEMLSQRPEGTSTSATGTDGMSRHPSSYRASLVGFEPSLCLGDLDVS